MSGPDALPFRPQPGHPDMVRHAPTNCPACGCRFDAATDVGGTGKSPTDGDWSLCLRCAEPLAYVISALGVVTLRVLDPTERAEFDASDASTERGKLLRFLRAKGQR